MPFLDGYVSKTCKNMSGFKNKEIASEAGKKGKPGKHKRTIEWENLGEFITQAGAERFKNIMLNTDDDTFTDMYLKALNYFKPKINHNINEQTEPTKIIFENVSDRKK